MRFDNSPRFSGPRRRLLAAAVAASLLVVSAFAGDPSGTWKWSAPGRDGQPMEMTLTLALKDGALTGTVVSPRHETPISNATFKDDQISFAVERVRPDGQKIVMKYEAKLDGESLKGSVERPNREGGTQKNDFTATRAK
jgi:hypothetical protein